MRQGRSPITPRDARRPAAVDVVYDEALRRACGALASFAAAPSRPTLEALDERLDALRCACRAAAKRPR